MFLRSPFGLSPWKRRGGGLHLLTLAHIARVEADGGTVTDTAALDTALRLFEAEGDYADMVILINPRWGAKFRVDGGVTYVSKLYDASPLEADWTQATEGNQPILADGAKLRFPSARTITSALGYDASGITDIHIADYPAIPLPESSRQLWRVRKGSGNKTLVRWSHFPLSGNLRPTRYTDTTSGSNRGLATGQDGRNLYGGLAGTAYADRAFYQKAGTGTGALFTAQTGVDEGILGMDAAHGDESIESVFVWRTMIGETKYNALVDGLLPIFSITPL